MGYLSKSLRHDLPGWFDSIRSFYCPVSGGAGAALMSFALDLDIKGKNKSEISEMIESSKQRQYEKSAGVELTKS